MVALDLLSHFVSWLWAYNQVDQEFQHKSTEISCSFSTQSPIAQGLDKGFFVSLSLALFCPLPPARLPHVATVDQELLYDVAVI